MKNTYLNVGIFALMIALLSYSNFARADDAATTDAGKVTQGARIEKRIDHQHKRIQKLEEKGKITEQQAADLNKKVDDVAAKEQAAKNEGGGLNKEERKELKQELHATGQEIKKARKSNKK